MEVFVAKQGVIMSHWRYVGSKRGQWGSMGDHRSSVELRGAKWGSLGLSGGSVGVRAQCIYIVYILTLAISAPRMGWSDYGISGISL